MTEPEPKGPIGQRAGFWTAVGAVMLAGVLIILFGPAMQPRSEVSDLTDTVIGPGIALFSLGAGLALRRSSQLAAAQWARVTAMILAWVAFGFALLMILASFSS